MCEGVEQSDLRVPPDQVRRTGSQTMAFALRKLKLDSDAGAWGTYGVLITKFRARVPAIRAREVRMVFIIFASGEEVVGGKYAREAA